MWTITDVAAVFRGVVIEHSPSPTSHRLNELYSTLLIEVLNQQRILRQIAYSAFKAINCRSRDSGMLFDLLLAKTKKLSSNL